MGIYKSYLDLIATRRKTTEIRVNDSSPTRPVRDFSDRSGGEPGRERPIGPQSPSGSADSYRG